MTLLSQKGFAALAGVSTPAISQSIKVGRLRYVEVDGIRGLDPEDELSRHYLADKHPRPASLTPVKEQKPDEASETETPSPQAEARAPRQASTNEPPSPGEKTRETRRPVEYGEVVAQRQRDAELKSRLLELKIDRENRARLLAIREIVPRSMSRRIWSDLGVSLRENVRTIPDRVSAQIAAICSHPELEIQIRELLVEEIEVGLARMAEATKRAISLMEQENE